MPVPSVVKITKNGVEYTSKVDQANYYISELTRTAMKDVGRFVMKKCATAVREINQYTKRARYAPKRYQMWVRKKENDLIVGIENIKYGAESAWWADQSELGTNGQPKRGILYNSVYNNIDTIIEIESQYLSALSEKEVDEGLIDEDELQEGAEE